jgi:mRNA-degrading endonuclease toxin of MazEF toxin-antitoxin module
VVNNDLQRGQIWWAKLAEPIGHAPGFNRPVLIVQANFANNSDHARQVHFYGQEAAYQP